MTIIEKCNGKRILIWGYGREGKSTRHFLDSHCTDCQIEILEGTFEEIEFSKYDYVIKSPGIRCDKIEPKIISQTDLFLEQFRDQIVGITGTKGKSTTSSMLYSVLEKCGRRALLVGNIGFPCLDYYDEIDPDTIIVFEMSCHQLAHAKQSPHIAVMLNLYEDHLDYYQTMERYLDAKLHIMRFQKEDDLFLVNKKVPLDEKPPAKTIYLDQENLPHNFKMELKGAHNQYNAEIVYSVAMEYGLLDKAVREAVASFHGLSHRLEYIGTVGGVAFYDDSISTICESAIQAAESVENCQTILIGGMDRGIDYSVLAEYFLNRNKAIHVICMYDSGRRVYDMLNGRAYTWLCRDLKEAVELAKKETVPGKSCVLSPAAASYDSFKNFEERGEVFKEMVFQNFP